MVNSISDVTAAADTRAVRCRIATGAFLAGRVDVAHTGPSSALMFARPRAIQGVGVSGHGRVAVVSGLPQGQPSIRKPYPNQARSAAAFSGGMLGSHPPRDPV
jgi:hypothetical protein